MNARLRGPSHGLWALALLACSSAAERTEPAPAARITPDAGPAAAVELKAAAAPTAPALERPARATFTLESAGRPPRTTLRYTPAPTTIHYEVRAALRARTLAPTAISAAIDVPAITERFTMEPGADAGTLIWRGQAVQIEGEGAAPYVARWRALLEGRRALVALDARGTLGALSFPDETQAQAQRDELAQRLLGSLVPLPEAAVGPGARWTVISRLQQGAAEVEQVARYRLIARTGQSLRLAVDVRRVGDAQRLSVADLPAGAALELVALFRAVTGEVTVRLDAPLPVGRLDIEARRHQRLRLADGSASDTITEDLGTLDLSLQLEPRPGKAKP